MSVEIALGGVEEEEAGCLVLITPLRRVDLHAAFDGQTSAAPQTVGATRGILRGDDVGGVKALISLSVANQRPSEVTVVGKGGHCGASQTKLDPE